MHRPLSVPSTGMGYAYVFWYPRMHALRRAIKLRQNFSNWFETTCPNDHKSNSAHRYFVNVLEKIADLFLQATRTTIVKSDEANTGNTNCDASKSSKQ